MLIVVYKNSNPINPDESRLIIGGTRSPQLAPSDFCNTGNNIVLMIKLDAL